MRGKVLEMAAGVAPYRPMPDLTLDHTALHDWLPHRGVNLFIDEVWTNEARNHSRSRVQIGTPDPRGRSLLLRTDERGEPCWNEPFLIELMALSGIAQLHEALKPRGLISVFSMVSRIVFHRLAPAGARIDGEAEMTRQRGDFSVFTTHASCDGQPLLEAEVMSGVASFDQIREVQPRPFRTPPPGEPIDPAVFAWKPPHLRFIDRIVREDRAARKLACSYIYPGDHPFCAGHFPTAPVMMGVTQWSAIADCAWLARQRFGLQGAVSAAGTIRREDGSEVLDVRDLMLEPLTGPAGTVPLLASTKRLAFRDLVRPGDGLIVEVSVTPQAGPGSPGSAA